MKKFKLKLKQDETIIAVVPEYCNGPGWSNTPIWLVIRDSSDIYRRVCLQPEEQTQLMRDTFKIAAAMSDMLLYEANLLK